MSEYSVFQRLCDLLSASSARFRVIQHAAEGKSDSVAAIRGTSPGQGAKAMLCTFKDDDACVLAVIPGDRKVDFRKIASVVGRKKATLASAELAAAMTHCVMGAVPPFAFNERIALVVDPELVTGNTEIAFNAGRLDRSIVMDASDYVRISRPLLADITREGASEVQRK